MTTCTGWVERGHLVIHGCNLELQSLPTLPPFAKATLLPCVVQNSSHLSLLCFLQMFKQKIDNNRAQAEVLLIAALRNLCRKLTQ